MGWMHQHCVRKMNQRTVWWHRGRSVLWKVIAWRVTAATTRVMTPARPIWSAVAAVKPMAPCATPLCTNATASTGNDPTATAGGLLRRLTGDGVCFVRHSSTRLVCTDADLPMPMALNIASVLCPPPPLYRAVECRPWAAVHPPGGHLCHFAPCVISPCPGTCAANGAGQGVHSSTQLRWLC